METLTKYLKIKKFAKKLDKMSIKPWGTVGKIQGKLEKVFVLNNICWN